LRQIIPMVLGLGLSGQPYSGPDIGGFSGAPTPELYLRWFQLAAFLPYFRTHSASYTPPREPWSFGEPYTSIVREFLRLRYRLLPYWYTLAWQASQTGVSPVRPLFWLGEADEALWEVDDAFLIGDSLLAAPVLEAGAVSRDVRLPCGVWFDFWDDTRYAGSGTIRLEIGLERIPLLARGGTVLPMESEGSLELHIYPPGGSQGLSPAGRLYYDAGDGYGDSRLDTFHLGFASGSLEMAWESLGDYPFPYPSVALHFHGLSIQKGWADGEPVAIKENRIELEAFHYLRVETVSSELH
jgi:alpha-glucosidase